jgi:uncharacterized protein DUF4249
MVGKKLYPLFIVFFMGCIVPEEPKFEYREGLVYVDALASTSVGTSFVKISESVLRLGALVNDFISGANVSFRNIDSGLIVGLSEQNGVYVPPDDFVVSIGETWELIIDLPNGKQYRARSEKVLKPVVFSNLRATYNPELSFRADLKRFVPGHFVSIDVNDPADEKNYYFWKFQSYEKLSICVTCENQIFRNGECIDVENDPNQGMAINLGEIDYYCDGDCWRIRYNENIKIFSDRFTEGGIINNIPVGDVLLYSRENILVEIQQISLTEAEYDYYKVLKDIVDNSSGLNAPPPAALIGNVFNPDDPEEAVLGRFTAASSTTMSLFINRGSVTELPIEPLKVFNSECFIFCGIMVCQLVDAEAICPYEILTPCSETRYRTSIKPEEWID